MHYEMIITAINLITVMLFSSLQCAVLLANEKLAKIAVADWPKNWLLGVKLQEMRPSSLAVEA